MFYTTCAAVMALLIAGSHMAPGGKHGSPKQVSRKTYALPNKYQTTLIHDSQTMMCRLEISRKGKMLHRLEGFELVGDGGVSQCFRLPALEGEEKLLKTIAQDVTGNGVPDLVVREYTGGAHCCTVTYVFELGETFVAFEPVHHGHDNGDNSFVQADNDAALEIVIEDWVFAYWHMPFSDSPGAKITLHFMIDKTHGGRWTFGNIKTQMDSSQTTVYEKRARGMAATAEGPTAPGNRPDLIRDLLDLVYSGNAEAVPHYLDLAFTGRDSQKQAFIIDLAIQLSRSKYIDAVLALNKTPSVGCLLTGQPAWYDDERGNPDAASP